MIMTPKKKPKEEPVELQVLPSLCSGCKNQHPDMTTCDAFPDGIPLEVLIGYVFHTKPYSKGGVSDGGVIYEPSR